MFRHVVRKKSANVSEELSVSVIRAIAVKWTRTSLYAFNFFQIINKRKYFNYFFIVVRTFIDFSNYKYSRSWKKLEWYFTAFSFHQLYTHAPLTSGLS